MYEDVYEGYEEQGRCRRYFVVRIISGDGTPGRVPLVSAGYHEARLPTTDVELELLMTTGTSTGRQSVVWRSATRFGQ